MEKPNFTNVENFDDGLTRIAPPSWWDLKKVEVEGWTSKLETLEECKQQHEKEMQKQKLFYETNVDNLTKELWKGYVKIEDVLRLLNVWGKNNINPLYLMELKDDIKALAQKEKTE